MNFKKLTGIALAAVISASACGLAACGENSKKDEFVVWCPQEAVELTTNQVNKFISENEDFPYELRVEPQGEGDAATNMITDVTAGADIFFFAQDQLARLIQAGALASVSSTYASGVKSANLSGSVDAATSGGTLYAYPLTADNGYFMYYDKSVITEDIIAQGQTAIIKACEDAGKQIGFQLSNSGWYAAAYFFATGCYSDWVSDDEGNFVSRTDNFNSANGIIAMRGMAELIASNSYVGTDSASTALFESNAAVVVSGTWDYNTALLSLGDNLGCSKLWSFNVDGKDYQLGSFAGYKLLGVKPQTDATKLAWSQSIANYLTGETCQTERFNELAWGPSNSKASENCSNQALSALADQNAYSVVQGQFPNAWWDASKALAATIEENKVAATDTNGLQAILDTYDESLNATLEASSVDGLIIVGSFADANWTMTNTNYLLNGDNTSYSSWSKDNPYVGVWTMDITLGKDSDGIFRICIYNDWKTAVAGYTELTSDSDTDYLYAWKEDNNIAVNAAGVYTVVVDTTKVTDPASSFSGATVKVTLKELIEEEAATAYVLVGTFSDYSWTTAAPDGDTVFDTKYKLSPMSGTWTKTVTFEGDWISFKICEYGTWTAIDLAIAEGSDEDVTLNNGNEIKLTTAGEYTLFIDTTGDIATVKVNKVS